MLDCHDIFLSLSTLEKVEIQLLAWQKYELDKYLSRQKCLSNSLSLSQHICVWLCFNKDNYDKYISIMHIKRNLNVTYRYTHTHFGSYNASNFYASHYTIICFNQIGWIPKTGRKESILRFREPHLLEGTKRGQYTPSNPNAA